MALNVISFLVNSFLAGGDLLSAVNLCKRLRPRFNRTNILVRRSSTSILISFLIQTV